MPEFPERAELVNFRPAPEHLIVAKLVDALVFLFGKLALFVGLLAGDKFAVIDILGLHGPRHEGGAVTADLFHGVIVALEKLAHWPGRGRLKPNLGRRLDPADDRTDAALKRQRGSGLGP